LIVLAGIGIVLAMILLVAFSLAAARLGADADRLAGRAGQND
jgi:hypothetical protein